MSNQFKMFKWIVFLLLGFYIDCQFYSGHTKCSQNRFTFKTSWIQFLFALMNNKQTRNNFYNLVQFSNYRLYHYGFQMKDPEVNGPCSNFIMHNSSCCSQSYYSQLSKEIKTAYRNAFKLAKYPPLDYLYKIHAELKKKIVCEKEPLNLPHIDGYNYNNSTQQFGQIIRKHDQSIQLIKNHEQQFINSTICLFCMGIHDFKTFMAPMQNSYHQLMVNKDYFINKTLKIGKVFQQLAQIDEKLKNLYKNKLKNMISSSSQCQYIQKMLIDEYQLNRRSLCNSQDSCKIIAMKYFGDVGAPEYSRIFQALNRGSNIARVANRVLAQGDLGFKGNTTYFPYQGKRPPKFTFYKSKFNLTQLWKKY